MGKGWEHRRPDLACCSGLGQLEGPHWTELLQRVELGHTSLLQLLPMVSWASLSLTTVLLITVILSPAPNSSLQGLWLGAGEERRVTLGA